MSQEEYNTPFAVVLGTAQDAGYPSPGCVRECCVAALENPELQRSPSCLGVFDPETKGKWLFDITPQFPKQWETMLNMVHYGNEEESEDGDDEEDDENEPDKGTVAPSGVFLTHAHMGHYTGLLHLGKETMGKKEIPVYVMPRMKTFLESNEPWGTLVRDKSIILHELHADTTVTVGSNISVTPFLVPHRDELSETVGFVVKCNGKGIVYLPDIDSWEEWERDIEEYIKNSSIAFLDGTFYSQEDVWKRDVKSIPHPFISDTVSRLSKLEDEERSKVHFTHLNHTNSLLDEMEDVLEQLIERGFNVAKERSKHPL